jgi:PQQ-dependent dehydrogenase (methanol/ethanol family)
LIARGKKLFETRCGLCHGADGTGGERGPDISQNRSDRVQTESDLREFIRRGSPDAGMPAFPLPDDQLVPLVAFVRSLSARAIETPSPGDFASGEAFFFGKGNCASCHMVNGRGEILGPDLSDVGREQKLSAIEESLRRPDAHIAQGYRVVTVRLNDGRSIRGFARNESNYDLQLQDFAGRLHFLHRHQIAERTYPEKSPMPPVEASDQEFRNLLAYLSNLSSLGPARPASTLKPLPGGIAFQRIVDPDPGDWPSYHGRLSGNRHSPLDRINTRNVTGLAVRWIFPIPEAKVLEVTPLVVDGVMYVTASNQLYAVDAASGREIWHYKRPRTKLMGGYGEVNRGASVLGDRVFMVTDNAHLIAIHRITGRLLWDAEMADYRQNYAATSAPLVVKDLVISGTSGGDEGVRGFLAAYKATTGERVWRFWTVPAPNEPLAQTWDPEALAHGCASTWYTGTYDPSTDLLYWPTGNPCPDMNGDNRQKDNLYSDSILALKPKTGELKWYYQFTPHDVHDWDATEAPVLIDAEFQGRMRKLLAQANRNGFLYVLDRTDGKILLAKPFVRKLTWASGIGNDGRPHVLPGTDPTSEGNKVCPAIEGASNWMSAAYNPATRLFYVMALEKCSIYKKLPTVWEAGKSYAGGVTKDVPGEPGQKFLRAINIESGKIVWEYPQIGPADSWGGVLSTAGALIFIADDSGALAAIDARTGEPLWNFHTSQSWKASPMTYAVGDKQYIAIAAGSNILAFALP